MIMVTRRILTGSIVAVAIALLQAWLGRSAAQGPARGHTERRLSPEIYTEWVRRSQYVAVRDGTRLALDVYRPASNGVAIDDRLPVVLTATPYLRARLDEKRLVTPVEGNSILCAALKRGFAVASLDLRGYGASFGRPGSQANDVADIVEWLASQPWATGKVGMFGCSAVGRSQFSAVSVTPAHLSTVAATSAPFDMHVVMRVNGVAQGPFLANFQKRMRTVDTTGSAIIPPVDDDPDGTLLQEALKERRVAWAQTGDITESRAAARFRPPLSGEG